MCLAEEHPRVGGDAKSSEDEETFVDAGWRQTPRDRYEELTLFGHGLVG